VDILARDYGDTIALLDCLGLEYSIYLKVPGSKLGKILSLPIGVLAAYDILKRVNPDLIVDAGLYGVYTARLLGKKCLIFSDSEPTPIQFIMMIPFVDRIITPSCFGKNLGKKHLRVKGYKELAYLHPNHFAPNPDVLDLLGVRNDEGYAILRFNAFDAVHDIGIKGFSDSQKRTLVNQLSKHVRVFISSEARLPSDLERYSIKVPKHRIHDALYYARLLVADTQTMVTEAAILGTPAVRFNTFVRDTDMGNFVELEKEYGLVANFDNADEAIAKAVEIVSTRDSKMEWTKRSQEMINDKIDVADFMSRLIGEYPKSLETLSENCMI
jgi:predicted glycosyltransferase